MGIGVPALVTQRKRDGGGLKLLESKNILIRFRRITIFGLLASIYKSYLTIPFFGGTSWN